MNNCAETALNDLAFALYDSCSRFTQPLQPDPKEITKLIKEKHSYTDASKMAKMVPRQLLSYEIDGFTVFQQTWSSTALGFGGIGGHAMTTANTIIVLYDGEACVYFGGRFAYKSIIRSDSFRADMFAQRMASVRESVKYQTKDNDQ